MGNFLVTVFNSVISTPGLCCILAAMSINSYEGWNNGWLCHERSSIGHLCTLGSVAFFKIISEEYHLL